MQNTGNTALKRMIFSDLLLTKSQGHRLAYMAVMAALSVVANMWLEFRLLDIQFSITIVVSALTGILLGPVSGFAVCYIGDLCGYFYNNWGQLYMPWVGLSTGMIALLAGLVFNLFPLYKAFARLFAVAVCLYDRDQYDGILFLLAESGIYFEIYPICNRYFRYGRHVLEVCLLPPVFRRTDMELYRQLCAFVCGGSHIKSHKTLENPHFVTM